MSDARVMDKLGPWTIALVDKMVLDENGRVRLWPTEFWRDLKPDVLRGWLHVKARYVVPTIELVGWLKDEIGHEMGIEIASGNGDLGFHVGIPETDSFLQQRIGQVVKFYKTMGQPRTNPRPGETLEAPAMAAVEWFGAEVVVAAWATERATAKGDLTHGHKSSSWGIRECEIIPRVRKYIHIGNSDIHGKKTALTQFADRLTIYPADFVVSRGDQDKNVIYVWENPDGD